VCFGAIALGTVEAAAPGASDGKAEDALTDARPQAFPQPLGRPKQTGLPQGLGKRCAFSTPPTVLIIRRFKTKNGTERYTLNVSREGELGGERF
jgi:hypothetical protein